MKYALMPRPAVVSAIENDIIIGVVVIVTVVEQIEFVKRREQSSSTGICLRRLDVLGPYILGGRCVQSKSGYHRMTQAHLRYSALLRILLPKVQS
jgi:hypothetical protein